MVRYTKLDTTDDPGYLDWVEATVVGVEEAINTKQTYVVKIDNWFGKRWQDAHAFWYSGRTASNDRGSFMAYVSTPDGHWPWYVSLRRDETWRVVECVGIGVLELETFAQRGIEELRQANDSQEL